MTTERIKIGVLFSQTGHMSVTENAHVQGVILACGEINESEGINGQLLEPIILNPECDDRKYAEMATELLLEHRVNAIFGCCLSTSRKAVLPVVERFNGVLFYPSVYEGFEYSPHVIYGGAIPNQMVLPLLEYVFQHHGRRIVLVGSDTLYSREINRIVKEFLAESGGEVVGENYLAFGTPGSQIESVLSQVESDTVDAIFSTVVGQDSVTLYTAYASTDFAKKNIPIASLTTTESELSQVSEEAREGHLSVSSYFSSLVSEDNSSFLNSYQQRYGVDSFPSVYTEVAYSLVHFYANAMRLSGKGSTVSLLNGLSGAVFKAPRGDLFVDPNTNHFTMRPHIGKSQKSGTFKLVWGSSHAIAPDPYLVTYDRSINGAISS